MSKRASRAAKERLRDCSILLKEPAEGSWPCQPSMKLACVKEALTDLVEYFLRLRDPANGKFQVFGGFRDHLALAQNGQCQQVITLGGLRAQLQSVARSHLRLSGAPEIQQCDCFVGLKDI